MADRNFIPEYRLVARRRRARIRRWATASVAWAIVLVTSYACAYTVWGGGRGTLLEDQKKVAARIQETSAAIRTLQKDLVTDRTVLQSGDLVRNQPDWSLLLALLPRALSGEVWLRRCELKPVATAPAASATATTSAPSAESDLSRTSGAADGPAAFTLRVNGCGKAMPAVLQFVQELEQAGLFDQVRLLGTTNELVDGAGVIGFQLECSLGRKAGAPK